MTTIPTTTKTPGALERARNSPRLQRAVRAVARTLFYTLIALISTAWAMAFPNMFLTGEFDPPRVLFYIALPGAIWLLIWHERRDDAKDRAKRATAC